ncbi:MAG: helix-turn-helix domain-containing protein [Clostridiaceae bacterium]
MAPRRKEHFYTICRQINELCKKIFRTRRGHNPIKLCLSYFLIVLVCVVGISAISYKYITDSTQSHIIESNAKLLGQFKKTIDEFILHNIDTISLSVFSSDEEYSVMYYLSQPLEKNTSYISRIYDRLQSMRNTSFFLVDSIAVYSQESDILISTDGVKYNPLQHNTDWVDTSWVDELNNMAERKYVWIGTRRLKNQNYAAKPDKDVITFVRKFTHSNEVYGMAISIPEDVLCGIIEDSAPIDFGQMFIIGEDGSIFSHSNKEYIYKNLTSIFSKGDTEKILGTTEKNGYYLLDVSGKRSVVSFTTSKYNNWKYIFIKPIDRFVEGFEFIRYIVLAISSVFVIIILVIIFYSLGKFYLPLIRLADESKKAIGNINCFGDKDCMNSSNTEYQIVCSTLGILSDKIRQQEKSIEDDLPVIKHYIINNLMMQHFQNEDDISERLKYIRVDFNYEYFGVLFLRIRSMATDLRILQIMKAHLADCIEGLMLQSGFISICTHYDNDIIILYNCKMPSPNLDEALKDVPGYVEAEFGACVTVAEGGVYKGLWNVHESYKDVKKCMKYLYTYPESKHISIDDVNKWEMHFVGIDGALIEDFYNNFRLRNQNMTLASAERLIYEMVEKHYSYDSVMMSLDRLIVFLENECSVLNINYQNVYSVGIFSELKQAEHIYDLQERMSNIIKELFLFIESRCNRRNKEIAEKAKEIIMKNVKNEYISLNMVSHAMYISPNYLSKVFKEETGMNFIDYVIDCRLETSVNLLLNTNLRIQDISIAVGYINCQYFIKKFRLKYGTTPGNYRTLHAADV